MLLLPVLFAVAAGGAITAVFGNGTSTPSQAALADIPADYLALYQRAATECPGLDWSILAAIGKIESDHGRSTLPGVANGTENAYHARVISRGDSALRHMRIPGDTPRSADVPARCKARLGLPSPARGGVPR